MNLRKYKTVKDRREALEKELSVDVSNIGSVYRGENAASTRNCENMIGISQIPIGIAGPLRISKDYYIPLATTEGALVASVNRGCKAISESGGAKTMSVKIGATRGPVFRVKNLDENNRLFEFIMSHKSELDTLSKKTSSHIALTDIEYTNAGHNTYVRFVFDTGDAMGMNMVTIATASMNRYIEKETGCACISLAGNYDVGKKPSWFNFTHGRGFEVWAEAVVSAQVLGNILKTDAKTIYDVWLSKCMIGSAVSGSMGFNAHYANILAALFAATGQDLGHIGECSVGITTAEVMKDSLYISVYLPDLMVGIVGGGTGLPTQKEALSIIGAKSSQEFVEVVGGAVLAGELSLLASLSVGTLARSHNKLARGNV